MFDLNKLFGVNKAIKDFKANLTGSFGEFVFHTVADFNLDDGYHILNNVVLNAGDRTAQIDLVIISGYGIFVVEVKTFKGWIFGNPDQAQWTQALYKKRYRFQNPLRQNYFHIKTLQQYLNFPDYVFKSLIVFSGEVKFKTVLPNNVVRGSEDFVYYIKQFSQLILTETEVNHSINVINDYRLSSGDHMVSIKKYKERVSNPDSSNLPICSRCNRKMVLRTARKGRNQGNQFWGCSGFPNCRYIINIER